MAILSKEERAFWGMNLNTAANNLMSIIQFIGGESDLEGSFSGIKDSRVMTVLNSGESHRIEQERYLKGLTKRLPFLGRYQTLQEEPPKVKERGEEKGPLRQMDRKRFADFLAYCAYILYEMRNNYSITLIIRMTNILWNRKISRNRVII